MRTRADVVKADVVKIGVAALCGFVGLATHAVAQVVTVSAQCNIYGAGHATPPSSCNTTIGPGILPVRIDLPVGATVVRLAGVSGVVTYCPTCPENGAEGNASTLFAFESLGGISGISSTRSRFFEGVFLGNDEPMNPAPAALVFDDFSFTDLSPQVAQHFYVGDGLTGSGTGSMQQFHVPAGATRLYLGFSDGFVPCVGAYSDNAGSITATVLVTTACAADFNGDGVVDPDDLADYIGAYFTVPPDAAADFNGDGGVDPDDLSDYITAFFAGCV